MNSEKKKELSIGEREIIINLHKGGKSHREIGRIVNRSRSTVKHVIDRYEKENRVQNKLRSGRPRKLSQRDEQKILRCVKKDPGLSAQKLAQDLKMYSGIDVHRSTISRTLHRAEYHSRTARKKPFINPINRKKRLHFANEYKNKDSEFWSKVLFTDESKFNVRGSDGRKLIWRRCGEELLPKNLKGTVKHGGGGVMVWGSMAANGTGELVFIDKIMDKYVYLDILKNNLQKSVEKLNLPRDYFFQQDNDPKHTAYIVRQWIVYNVPHILQTPPQSPDINPIEHLWAVLEKQLQTKHDINNKEQLKQCIIEEWNKMDPNITKNLVESMPRRMQAIIDAKGYPTKY